MLGKGCLETVDCNMKILNRSIHGDKDQICKDDEIVYINIFTPQETLNDQVQ